MNIPSFGTRLGYAIWLRHLATGSAPGFSEIGGEVGRTGQAVSAWVKRDEAPSDYKIQAPLSAFLGVESQWLIEGDGDPPRPELWAVWKDARTKQAKAPNRKGGVVVARATTIPTPSRRPT